MPRYAIEYTRDYEPDVPRLLVVDANTAVAAIDEAKLQLGYFGFAINNMYNQQEDAWQDHLPTGR